MKKSFGFLLAFICSLSLASCSDTSDNSSVGGDNSSVTETSVSSISMSTLPTKTTYYVNEEFDPTGGVVAVTYSDSSTSNVDLSDDMFSITSDTSTAGTSNVIVRLASNSSIRTTFSIEVINVTYDVTFDYNYEDAPNATIVSVIEGETVAKPEDPERDGYEFDAWYTGATTGNEYDFSTPVTSDLTLYARWVSAGATTYSFTFDYNYYGVAPSTVVQRVEENTTASRINDPTRTGYTFTGWYTDSTATTEYDFDTLVTADTTIYAGWSKNEESYGQHDYRFEVEDVDFTGKVGNGLSGTATETAMILVDNYGLDASNGHFVGYMYKQGLSLDIRFTSDIDVDEATLTVRMSQEVDGYTYNQENFQISFNNTSLDYEITFEDDEVPAMNAAVPYAQFKEVSINITGIRGGRNNLLRLTTANNEAVDGTTMTSHAPLLDCVTFSVTDAVLTWDGNYGLPVAGNY